MKKSDSGIKKSEGIIFEKGFYGVLIREFWGIIKLNLCFVIFSLPIFTIGAALIAMHKITSDMANDIPNDPVYDFKMYFFVAIRRSVSVWLLVLTIFLLSAFSTIIYFSAATLSDCGTILYLPAVVSLAVFFFMLFVSPYIFRIPELTETQCNKSKTTIKKFFSRAFATSVINFRQTLISSLLLFTVLFVKIGYYPYSVPIFLFYGNAFFSVLISYIFRKISYYQSC